MNISALRLSRRLQQTMLAFGAMLLEVPATILQLVGVLPGLFPLWYNLCRMSTSLTAVIIAVFVRQERRNGP